MSHYATNTIEIDKRVQSCLTKCLQMRKHENTNESKLERKKIAKYLFALTKRIFNPSVCGDNNYLRITRDRERERDKERAVKNKSTFERRKKTIRIIGLLCII